MSVQLMSTKTLSRNGVKILVYGGAGSGKTTLCKTMPNPIIISAEGGMLSLAGVDLPVIEVSTLSELSEAYKFCIDSNYASICLDSISEIAEVILVNEKKTAKDPRQAYGTMQDQTIELIRAFRDIKGKHVYFSCKMEREKDEIGRLLYSPSMPGNKLGQNLPYFFDEVLCLRVEKNQETGETNRALQADTDGIYVAKDRSCKLDMWESPDLGAIIKKIEA